MRAGAGKAVTAETLSEQEKAGRDLIEIPKVALASAPSVTDYVLEQPAKCPNCRRDILEKTLVEPK